MESSNPDYHTFILKGNRKVSILLIHGFLSFPGEMKRLAIKLNENGFTCLSVQLPGHFPPDNVNMRLYTFEDWVKEIEVSYNKLIECSSAVIVCGASMGGNLAIQLASQYNVCGLITICTPLSPNFSRFPFTLLLNPIIFFLSKLKIEIRRSVRSHLPCVPEEFRSLADTTSYHVPISIFSEVIKIIQRSSSNIRSIKCPLIVIQAKSDELVPARLAKEIVNNALSEEKELVYLDKSGHAALFDYQHELIEEKILQFAIKLDKKISL